MRTIISVAAITMSTVLYAHAAPDVHGFSAPTAVAAKQGGGHVAKHHQANRSRHVSTSRRGDHRRRTVVASVGGGYLPHPAGCPSRAFCGCGAAVEVFGRPVRNLWLARNWYGFARDNPAPGNAAVRLHHVFILKQHVRDNLWLVADHNSGGHRSRLHVRSIAGYTIVNPRGGNRYARL